VEELISFDATMKAKYVYTMATNKNETLYIGVTNNLLIVFGSTKRMYIRDLPRSMVCIVWSGMKLRPMLRGLS
jgi:hypothetical protein